MPNEASKRPEEMDRPNLLVGALMKHDPDGWLVDALTKLPPGSQLHEAWTAGPASLFDFLNALWLAETAHAAHTRREGFTVPTNPADDDGPLESPAYESAL